MLRAKLMFAIDDVSSLILGQLKDETPVFYPRGQLRPCLPNSFQFWYKTKPGHQYPGRRVRPVVAPSCIPRFVLAAACEFFTECFDGNTYAAGQVGVSG